MSEVLPMPSFGDLFTDTRGGDRTMRVSYHGDRETVVVSLWSGTVCRGSFRLAADDVSRLVSTLSEIMSATNPTATAGPRSDGSGTGAGDPGTAAVDPAGAAAPPIDQTGDISGLAERTRLTPVPPLRVA